MEGGGLHPPAHVRPGRSDNRTKNGRLSRNIQVASVSCCYQRWYVLTLVLVSCCVACGDMCVVESTITVLRVCGHGRMVARGLCVFVG